MKKFTLLHLPVVQYDNSRRNLLIDKETSDRLHDAAEATGYTVTQLALWCINTMLDNTEFVSQ